MGQKIQIRRGNEANLPELANGELALTIDTKKVFVGTPSGNIPVSGASAESISVTDISNHFIGTNVESVLEELFTFANDGKTVVANAVTAQGVSASPSDTFSVLADKIGQIFTGKKFAIGSVASVSISTPNGTYDVATNLSFNLTAFYGKVGNNVFFGFKDASGVWVGNASSWGVEVLEPTLTTKVILRNTSASTRSGKLDWVAIE